MSDPISFGFLAPPTVLILVSALAAWLALWQARLGIAAAIAATSLLYLAALPVVAARLLQEVEVTVPPNPDFSAAQAIVVLGGGVRRGDGDRIADTLGPWSLERTIFAARAYRRLHLKVAVSGGRTGGARMAEATLMKSLLEGELGVPVGWVEDQSRSTWENAALTARLLRPEGVTTVVLVTHAWHMKRALWSFARAGLHPLPWPAPKTYDEAGRLDDYLPSTTALQDSFHALHEAIGMIYYRFRYGGS
ncbi:MAG TPA: YdcF family protein [Stellaceae bacterium]|nr:YdcF family protein [Stellaceae bacterium]